MIRGYTWTSSKSGLVCWWWTSNSHLMTIKERIIKCFIKCSRWYFIWTNESHDVCHVKLLCHFRSRPELNLWTFVLFVYHFCTVHSFLFRTHMQDVPQIFHKLSWKHAFEISIIAALIFSLWNHIDNNKALNLPSININENQFPMIFNE